MEFKLVSEFKPTGDQPEAIRQLLDGLKKDIPYQTLLGVTGSGKTFTVANVIQGFEKPTLVLSHNKTLAAQLYSEFKQFFPENAVEYYVSYYDYYQPEAFLPVTNTYIEKDLSINDEIEKLRLKATASLLSGRKDVIVVSSVSCIYGIGNPEQFSKGALVLHKGQTIDRDNILRSLVANLYSRNEIEFSRGNFRVKGDTIDVFLAYGDFALRIMMWDDEIESLEFIDPVTGERIDKLDEAVIFPANLFVTSQDQIFSAIKLMQDDLTEQIQYFKDIGKHLEAKRLEERVEYDIEMIKELGHCSGIENYSRYFDGRDPGSRPFCLLDYFPDDFLMVIDESHVTLPQVRAMYGGDRSRKVNLVDHGFRLPAALDNRPLKFEEFEMLTNQVIYVSATPTDYELEKSEGVIVEQLIRPTGLIDPEIEIKPSLNQIDDLIAQINERTPKDERVLVTTLTKRMAEELQKYFDKLDIRSAYIHSDVDTLERVEIIDNLRNGVFDVLIGVNLLREGLDMPEVSLVAILDADKEGFLRSERSLTQTAGRAARNINGKVIMYADTITNSMQRTIDETNRRRVKQIQYNIDNNITPRQIVKAKRATIESEQEPISKNRDFVAAEPEVMYLSRSAVEKEIQKARLSMENAAQNMDFIEAAKFRDRIYSLERKLEEIV